MLQAGVEPASCRLGVDNRTRSGPQQQMSSRSWRAVGLRSRTAAGQVQTWNRSSLEITEPLRPATKQVRQGSNPDQRGWSSPCYRLHHGPVKRTTRIERASPGWRPGALPAELRPHIRAAGLESADSDLDRIAQELHLGDRRLLASEGCGHDQVEDHRNQREDDRCPDRCPEELVDRQMARDRIDDLE
jgi:hypothetical protein